MPHLSAYGVDCSNLFLFLLFLLLRSRMFAWHQSLRRQQLKSGETAVEQSSGEAFDIVNNLLIIYLITIPYEVGIFHAIANSND